MHIHEKQPPVYTIKHIQHLYIYIFHEYAYFYLFFFDKFSNSGDFHKPLFDASYQDYIIDDVLKYRNTSVFIIGT